VALGIPEPRPPQRHAALRGEEAVFIDLTVVDKALAAYPLAEHVRLLLRRKSTKADTGLKGRRLRHSLNFSAPFLNFVIPLIEKPILYLKKEFRRLTSA